MLGLHRDRGLPVVVLRPVGIYGPGDRRFVKLFRGVARRKFPMIGRGDVFYHLTHVGGRRARFHPGRGDGSRRERRGVHPCGRPLHDDQRARRAHCQKGRRRAAVAPAARGSALRCRCCLWKLCAGRSASSLRFTGADSIFFARIAPSRSTKRARFSAGSRRSSSTPVSPRLSSGIVPRGGV